MIKKSFLACAVLLALALPAGAQNVFQKDTISTSRGDLTITFIGHASLMFSFGGKTIYVDPWGKLADYSTLPKADIVLVTHDHFDHLDRKALKDVATDRTSIVITQGCEKQGVQGIIMKNGDVRTIDGLEIEAVPAYNVVNKRPDGQPFHPKGTGNGYVITIGDKRVYVAGDTENIPEMKKLAGIDIAFLPMNLPYTMTSEMAAEAALAIKPKILYPYHFGDTDTARLVDLLKKNPAIDVRIRKMN
ncbi:MAG: MBL fold metallo-hydrolase [Candidatus Krumholzibacteria bacterium]|nr:MBL fold metallo-hydrolase [Candidatus Krumholzibacteria bacterium]